MEKKRDKEMGLTAAASEVSGRRDPECDNQISLDSLKERDVLDMIKSLDINTMTPLEALNLLYSLKQRLQ
jgi:DNA mismatch repair protein MutS